MYTQFTKQVEQDAFKQLDYLSFRNKDLVTEYNVLKHHK